MDYFVIATILIFLSAAFGYINLRVFKLPNTIGLMLVSILFTIVVFVLSFFDDTLLNTERFIVESIDFRTLLFDGMLSFLLFAGAIHTELDDIKKLARPIVTFATLGVLASTFFVGSFLYLILPLIGIDLSYVYCLLFGALISPTDPIAVLGILKQVGAPKKLETLIVGESLFNDGIGVIVFALIIGVVNTGMEALSAGHVITLFLEEAVGGVVLGIALGYIATFFMKRIDDYEIEVIITIAVVMVGTFIAQQVHTSAPLAMVVSGLMIGNTRKDKEIMSHEVEEYTDKFWELIDMLLNTVLFVLMGMEMLSLTFEWSFLWAGLLTIPIVLMSRYLALWGPVSYYRKLFNFKKGTLNVLTWAGLRGAISIALALSLTDYPGHELFIFMTYIVVVFSIIVQGLTVGNYIRQYFPCSDTDNNQEH